jgi:enamine deaminase RidA (YjgF/YER057c/UK114 family)
MRSRLRASTSDRSTGSHGSFDWACRVATSGDVRDQPKVADGASTLLQDVFGEERNPCRLVYGVASLPLGTPVELEIIFEVAG